MPRYGFPIVPSGIQAGIGLVDGLISASDASAGRTRYLGGSTPSGASAPGVPRSVMFQGAAVATGFLGWFMNWPTDFVDPLIGAPLTLVMREAGFRMGQSGKSAPQTAQGWRAVANAPDAVHALTGPAPNGRQAFRQRQPAGHV
ncbi:MAG TPA: hypothetical protein VMU89_14780 [Thermomicrobiaceae bacterium]|nr:hypothetical protein [Thermomicrobiaceae bacterium]